MNGSFSAQWMQMPQPIPHMPVTMSPTLTRSTFLPTSTTSPAHSWPMTGPTGQTMPCSVQPEVQLMSVPQTPQRPILTISSFSPGVGSGTSSIENGLPGGVTTNARMNFSPRRLPAPADLTAANPLHDDLMALFGRDPRRIGRQVLMNFGSFHPPERRHRPGRGFIPAADEMAGLALLRIEPVGDAGI